MIVVTGGAGLIGSAVIWYLNRQGRDNILVVDHLGTGEKWKNLVPLRFTDYIEKDTFLCKITNTTVSWPLPGKADSIDGIIHLGACSSTTEQDASYLIANNFEYSKHLALFAMKHSIRFIYASSAATYGDGSSGFMDRRKNLYELRSLNKYGLSKQMFDVWAMENGLLETIVGLKYFNVFGPNEYHKGDMRSLVLKAYGQIIDTGKIQLFKSYRGDFPDGEQQRDFIYVKDAAAMTVHFLNNRCSGIFNVGSGKATTWNSLATAIFKSLGKALQIEYIDMPDAIQEKYQYYTCADISKLRQAGYKEPITEKDEAIDDYLNYYLLPSKRLGE